MTSFTSTAQWVSGTEVADYLDSFFADRGWRIEPTTRHEERDLCMGDRHYYRGNEHYFVEYKSGIQTFYTGNVFLETISVDSQNKPGWVYTCQAHYIFYAALLNHKILVWLPDDLRSKIEMLKQLYTVTKTRKGQNKGYNTHGVIIPLADAENLFTRKIYETESEN